MSKLIDVADVKRGDGQWTAGLEVESLQCALSSAVLPLCLPAPGSNLGGSASGGPSGFPISIFAVAAKLRQPTMCRTASPEDVVRTAVDGEFDKAAGHALWYGTGNAEVWIGADGATSVAADAGIGEMLHAFYAKTVGVEPILHLGLQAAMDFGPSFQNGRLAPFPEVEVVVNPGYPVDGVAITGPIDLWAGQIETVQVHDVRINRQETEAAMLAGLAFDPCTAVVRGPLPDQTYVGQDGLTVTAFAINTTTASTVSWGDASADGTIPAGSEAGLDHTYAAPGTYTVTVTSESGPTTYKITV